MSRSTSAQKPTPLPSVLSPYQSRVRVKAGDSILLVGTRGSGKTVAAKMLDRTIGKLFPTSRHYIFDSKFDGDFDEYPGRVQSDKAPPKPSGNQLYQVWQPINLIPDEIEKWLNQILQDPPAILFVDELVHLRYKVGVYSPKYNEIQKIGRSLPILTLTCTQELSQIPPNAYKQSNHRFGFYIDKAAEYDKRLLNSLLKEKVQDPEDEFGFYYQQAKGRQSPLYFPTIQKFLLGDTQQ